MAPGQAASPLSVFGPLPGPAPSRAHCTPDRAPSADYQLSLQCRRVSLERGYPLLECLGVLGCHGVITWKSDGCRRQLDPPGRLI